MKTAIAKKAKLKICSRGHHYYGSGPCPICWPGGLKKKKGKAKVNAS